MKIGTLGAGEVAQAVAIQLLETGHEVLLSNSRCPGTLKQLVSKLGKGARTVTMDEAAKAPIVLLAVPWPRVEAVFGKLPDWEGRILIDATSTRYEPESVAGANGLDTCHVMETFSPIRSRCGRPNSETRTS